MHKRVIFKGTVVPLLLVLPQLAITLVFFIWPAAEALWQSLLRQDAFGIRTTFVGLENFRRLLADPTYLNAFDNTVVFSLAVTVIALSIGLFLAVMADGVIRGATAYKTLLVWPYAVAPAIAGVLWWFLLNPTVGILAYFLQSLGYAWNSQISGTDAMILVVVAASWKQVSYNFLFFLAGMQAIPRSLLEAAAIDGAGPVKRFWTIVFPLLSPTTFFLLVVNLVYAFFDTFALIHTTTSGGPGQATTILVYKVFTDGFIGLNLGSSAAQSVILMAIVIALTAVQFRFVERRVQY